LIDATSGLTAFDAKGGIESAGVVAGYLKQMNRRWGLYS
jgi:MipA family protein